MSILQTIIYNQVIALLIAVIIGLTGPQNWLNNLLISFIYSNLIGGFLSVFINRFYGLLERSSPVKKIIYSLFIFCASALLGTEIGLVILLVFRLIPAANFGIDHLILLFFNLFIAFVFGTISLIYIITKKQLEESKLKIKEKELREQEIEKQKTEAELAALQAKINPHFLFNTLNSIASLISQDPQKAEIAVEKLAALFRFTLKASSGHMVTIREECSIVQDYLDIEKLRFGKRLQFFIDMDPALSDVPIPSLILQPIVENSIKHNISKRIGGGKIELSITKNEVEKNFLIRISDLPFNPGQEEFSLPEKETPGTGYGLINIQARLKNIYGENFGFSTKMEEGMTVLITLPNA